MCRFVEPYLKYRNLESTYHISVAGGQELTSTEPAYILGEFLRMHNIIISLFKNINPRYSSGFYPRARRVVYELDKTDKVI